jgi:hypothetical protein
MQKEDWQQAYLEIFVVFCHHVRREVERKRRQPNFFHSLPQGARKVVGGISEWGSH